MGPRETSRDDIEVVRVARVIEVDAPVERVWDSMSRLDQLAGWLGLDVQPDGRGPGDVAGDRVDGVDGVAGDGIDGVDLVVGGAVRVVEPDGSVRHLLVTEVDGPHRLAWHWWREDGELSAVEITVEPAGRGGEAGRPGSVVRVVETLAVASAGAGGRLALEVTVRLDAEWGAVLPGLASRLGAKLGVPTPR